MQEIDALEEIDWICSDFDAALRRGDAPRAEQYVERAVKAGREELARELAQVEADYRSAEDSSLFLDELESRWPEYAEMVASRIKRTGPVTVDGYRDCVEIARGGMGIIYRAHDAQLPRILAIKLLNEKWRDTPGLERRFRREAEIQSELQHPGIPPIKEFGRLADGQPYFSMKLVEGRTLDDLLRAPGTLSILEKLAIFEHVCQTLAFAHSRGIVHRDVKPMNVMVGEFDEVQLMDWGLAVKCDQRESVALAEGHPELVSVRLAADTDFVMTDGTDTEDVLTRAGTIIGTPGYLPPEQARGDIAAITPRSDVFSLGSILCELLTGAPAFRGSDLIGQTQRGETTDAIERLSTTEVDDDLKSIAEHCIATDPAERPENAGEVAANLSAYLLSAEARLEQERANRAAADVRTIEERRRHSLLFRASVIISLVMVVGAAFSIWQAVVASDERSKAKNAEAVANRAAAQAKEQANAAKEVADFLQELLESRSPFGFQGLRGGSGAGYRTERELGYKEKQITERFKDRPIIEARMKDVLGSIYFNLGREKKGLALVREALAQRRKTLGETHVDYADSLFHVGSILHYLERRAEARGYFARATKILEKVKGSELKLADVQFHMAWSYIQLGIGHKDAPMKNYKVAEKLLRQAYATRAKRLPAGHWKIAMTTGTLAFVLVQQKRELSALTMAMKAFTTKEQQDIIRQYTAATKAKQAGDWKTCIAHYRKILTYVRNQFGEHPATAYALGEMATLLHKAGQNAEARKAMREAVDIGKRVLPRHPQLLKEVRNWSVAEEKAGDIRRAHALAVEALEIARRRFKDTDSIIADIKRRIKSLADRIRKPM